MATQIDVVMLKFLEIYQTANRRNRGLFTYLTKNFGCLSNCRCCTYRTRNLPGIAGNIWLTLFRFHLNRFTFGGVIAEIEREHRTLPALYFYDSPGGFFGKRPLTVKFSQFCSGSFYRLTDRRCVQMS